MSGTFEWWSQPKNFLLCRCEIFFQIDMLNISCRHWDNVVSQAKDQLNLLRTNIGLTQMLTYVRSNILIITTIMIIVIMPLITILRSINTLTADEEMTNVFGESDLLIWQKVHLSLNTKTHFRSHLNDWSPPDKRQDPGETHIGHVPVNTNARERSAEVHVSGQVIINSFVF